MGERGDGLPDVNWLPEIIITNTQATFTLFVLFGRHKANLNYIKFNHTTKHHLNN